VYKGCVPLRLFFINCNYFIKKKKKDTLYTSLTNRTSGSWVLYWSIKIVLVKKEEEEEEEIQTLRGGNYLSISQRTPSLTPTTTRGPTGRFCSVGKRVTATDTPPPPTAISLTFLSSISFGIAESSPSTLDCFGKVKKGGTEGACWKEANRTTWKGGIVLTKSKAKKKKKKEKRKKEFYSCI